MYAVHWIYAQQRSYQVKAKLSRAKSFEEWEEYALELDKLYGLHKWKLDPRSDYFDYKNTQYLTVFLKELRKRDLTQGLLHTLRSSLHKNLYGIMNPMLYERSYTGTKTVITNFQKEIIASLHHVYKDKKMSTEEKLKFFTEGRHSYGRTAIMFSGGASMGVYHMGFLKVLKEQNLMPRIICGSSAGSIFAALITSRTIDHFDQLIDPFEIDFQCFKYKEDTTMMTVARFLKDGVLMDMKHLQKFLKKYLGETTTFIENYEKTGWILNVSVSSIHSKDTPRLLNYITTPNLLIWSAVSASCAIPKIFEPVELLSKNYKGEIVPYTATTNHRFIDGSLTADLPMQRMSEIFNVNTFIVSQVNPFVIPFITDDGGGVLGSQAPLYKRAKHLIMNECYHVFDLLCSLGLIPKQVESIIGLATQNYKGHVTVSPKVRVSDYLNILQNPTPEYIAQALEISQLYTYPKMSIIRSIYEVEREIHKLAVLCKQKLDRTVPKAMLTNDTVNPCFEEYGSLASQELRLKSNSRDVIDKHGENDRNSEGGRKFSNTSSDNEEDKERKGLRRVTSQENTHSMIRHLKPRHGIGFKKHPNQVKQEGRKLSSAQSHESLQTIVSDYVEEHEEFHNRRNEISERAELWRSARSSGDEETP